MDFLLKEAISDVEVLYTGRGKDSGLKT